CTHAATALSGVNFTGMCLMPATWIEVRRSLGALKAEAKLVNRSARRRAEAHSRAWLIAARRARGWRGPGRALLPPARMTPRLRSGPYHLRSGPARARVFGSVASE